jgi:uncharacterized protein YqgC (DUF456 family)
VDWTVILQYAGQALAVILIVGGLIGTLFPVLPGTPIIFVGTLLWGWATGFVAVDARTLIALGLVAVLSWVLGQVAGTVGSKTFGSSKWGIIGAIVGSIVALFAGGLLGPFGFVIFPFLGAFLFELLAGRKTWQKSLKSGLGSAIGVLGGIVMQFAFGVVMVIIFARALF